MQVSVELLYHFRCDHCVGWWSVGDFEWVVGKRVFCPHCGEVNTLPSDPLLAADFKSEG